MIKLLICAFGILLYLAIGVFMDEVINDDTSSIIMLFFWPLVIILAIILMLCVYVPVEVAKRIKKYLH